MVETRAPSQDSAWDPYSSWGREMAFCRVFQACGATQTSAYIILERRFYWFPQLRSCSRRKALTSTESANALLYTDEVGHRAIPSLAICSRVMDLRNQYQQYQLAVPGSPTNPTENCGAPLHLLPQAPKATGSTATLYLSRLILHPHILTYLTELD